MVSAVSRPSRNPRRTYNRDGTEIAPATIANARQNGAEAIMVECGCGHTGRIELDALNPDEFVPDVVLRCRCTACGGRPNLTYPLWGSVRMGAGRT